MPSTSSTSVLSIFTLILFYLSHYPVHGLQRYYKKYGITVMTFNTWVGGENVWNGLQKIVDHIKIVDPDIVAFQEMEREKVMWIINGLNSTVWNICDNINNQLTNNAYVITKFNVVHEYMPGPGLRNVGCQVQVDLNEDGSRLNVWNWHLPTFPYAPYDICVYNRVGTYKDLMQSEYNERNNGGENRVSLILDLMEHDDFHLVMSKTDKVPLILAGDFNSPSHLDWLDATRNSHCNWVVEWPITKILYDQGLRDSFRTIYPNPSTHPGFTWSPIYKYNWNVPFKLEPTDRIDMILYKGRKLVPMSSVVYDGDKIISLYPNHQNNHWPSDHSSVITDFKFRL